MAGLSQIALEFTRECMGWEDADLCAAPTSTGIDRFLVNQSTSQALMYDDLNAVAEAAHGWCDQHNHILETSYLRGSHMARVITAANRHYAAWEHDDHACAVLLRACLSAARNLKQTT